MRAEPRAEAHYVDERSGATYSIDDPRWCGDDGAPLTVSALPGITREQVDTGARSLWRYRAALPVRIDAPVSLGEGCTPLVEKGWGRIGFCSSWSGSAPPAASRTAAPA
ncbi:hypothetical protein SANT12839_031280 [Streptomyces antimycoticus]|uniref:Uncharacterized protein n=1 Tax=Streptomyces antimycoticus TaxID=68175 RepID=A0A4D4K679_9ACTN|nr:hypothetical protein SANT12839_031280 [Streptomyces antimycoticus]